MLKKLMKSLAIAAIFLALAPLQAQEIKLDPATIEEVTDLQALASLARQQQTPILLMFSQKGCAYCVILEEDYLKPMLRSGDYLNKVIIRKVRIDSFDTLRGFDGNQLGADQLATRYRAYVTPTMVFLDHTGKELAKRLLGIGTEGYFAAEIDQAIDTSLHRLRAVAVNR